MHSVFDTVKEDSTHVLVEINRDKPQNLTLRSKVSMINCKKQRSKQFRNYWTRRKRTIFRSFFPPVCAVQGFIWSTSEESYAVGTNSTET